MVLLKPCTFAIILERPKVNCVVFRLNITTPNMNVFCKVLSLRKTPWLILSSLKFMCIIYHFMCLHRYTMNLMILHIFTFKVIPNSNWQPTFSPSQVRPFWGVARWDHLYFNDKSMLWGRAMDLEHPFAPRDVGSSDLWKMRCFVMFFVVLLVKLEAKLKISIVFTDGDLDGETTDFTAMCFSGYPKLLFWCQG